MAVPVERLVGMVSEYDYLYDMTKKLYHNPQFKEAAWIRIGECLGVSGDICKAKWKYLRDKYKKEKRAEEERSGAEGGSRKMWKYMEIMGFLDSYMQEKPTSSVREEPEVKEEPQPHLICSAADSEDQTDDSQDASCPSSPEPSSDCAPLSATHLDDAPPSATHPVPTSSRLPSVQSTPHPMPTPLPVISSISGGLGKKREAPASALTPYQERVLQAISTEQDEHEHFLLSLAPAFRRLEPRKQSLVRLRFQQTLFDVEFGE
ncbi:uncharacterized protein LOC143016813 [Genypterus blacodes]|uniref:uncharacterized protein LOC143016813 n=1 Tax=Genypterus blacodes TaxID=154954 RepID=UPI003F7775E3